MEGLLAAQLSAALTELWDLEFSLGPEDAIETAREKAARLQERLEEITGKKQDGYKYALLCAYAMQQQDTIRRLEKAVSELKKGSRRPGAFRRGK